MTAGALRQRPIYGGVFGKGQYALATKPCISNGLHAVKFMVIEPRKGSVLSVADSKLEALAAARRVLRVGALMDEASNDPHWDQASLWDEDATPPSVALAPRRVSGRRQAIFQKSEGRCHYCRKPLTLDGKWHVEHQLPRALGGGDDSGNLVASCVPCNLRKGDQTAVEFVSAGTNSQ